MKQPKPELVMETANKITCCCCIANQPFAPGTDLSGKRKRCGWPGITHQRFKQNAAVRIAEDTF